MYDAPEAEKIYFHFYYVEAGFIQFHVIAGAQAYRTTFSNVFDPIRDLKNWLEALCTGVYECTFYYDEEGPQTLWSYTQVRWDASVFQIKEYPDGEVLLSCKIERKNLISDIYTAFLELFASDRYDPEEWETVEAWERLFHLTGKTYNELLNDMSVMSREDLNRILSYMNYYKVIKSDRIFSYDELILTDDDLTNDYLPPDYDALPLSGKRKALKTCLKRYINDYHNGEKVEIFRSDVVNNYLWKETEREFAKDRERRLLDAISAMDIESIKIIQKYPPLLWNGSDTFPEELEKAFRQFRHSGDTHLIPATAFCDGDCHENGKAYAFSGNHTGNYFCLVFKESEAGAIEVSTCSEFTASACHSLTGEKVFPEF